MNTVDEATAELIRQNALLLRRNSVQSPLSYLKHHLTFSLDLFQGYYYDSTAKETKETVKNVGTSKSKQSTNSGSSIGTVQTTNYSKDSGY